MNVHYCIEDKDKEDIQVDGPIMTVPLLWRHHHIF
jgi:hypothetical protein